MNRKGVCEGRKVDSISLSVMLLCSIDTGETVRGVYWEEISLLYKPKLKMSPVTRVSGLHAFSEVPFH